MNSLFLERLGKPGIAAIGVLLFCLSFYAGSIAPAQDELARLNGELAAAAPAAAAAAGGAPVAAASRSLPSFATASDVLKALSDLAEQHGVTIDRATYQLSGRERATEGQREGQPERQGDGQRRLEINLPVNASYPALRAYLRAVLAMPAAPTLDELTLQRRLASDALLEANVRLSYFFAPSP